MMYGYTFGWLLLCGWIFLVASADEFDYELYQNETGCEPFPLENGYYVNASHPRLGVVVQAMCYMGYRLEGPQVRICNSTTGELEGDEPICNGCQLPPLENGTYLDISNRNLGLAVQVMCTPGYRLMGSPVRVCNISTGNWTDPDDSINNIDSFCEEIDECRPIKDVGADTERGEDVTSFDTDIEFKDDVTNNSPCHENADCFNTDGSYNCSCREGFLGDGFQCRSKDDCEPLSNPGNGKVTLSRKAARYECNPGYILYGARFRRCRRQKWNYVQPFCAPRADICPPLSDIKHGRRFGDNLEIGARVRYTCDAGYELIGPDERDCTEGQVWTGVDPFCESRKTIADIAAALKREVTILGSSSSTSPHARLFQKDARGVDLVFLIDKSSSITGDNFERGKDFIKNIIREFGVDNANQNEGGTRIALITFGTTVKMIFNLDDTKIKSPKNIDNKLQKIKGHGGGTALRQALEKVFLKVAPLTRSKSQKAIFILADGQSNVGKAPDPMHMARNLREGKGFEIFAVGVGKLVERVELRKVASEPYSSHVFVLSTFENLVTLKDLIVQDKSVHSTCGFAGDVYSGESGYRKKYTSKKGAWPWLVRIINERNSDTCGGALICRRWVLTSTQCLYGATAQEITVELGVHGIDEVGQRISSVKDFHFHPEYKLTADDYKLALLEFDETSPANISRLVHPVCLTNNPGRPDESIVTSKVGELLWIAGWGNKPPGSAASEGGWREPKDFMLPVVHSKTCKDSFPHVKFTDNLFCAGERYNNNTACKGDIGGPLVYKRGDRYVAVAVAHRTQNCYQKDKYGLFTKVISPGIAGWIHNVTQNCNLELQKGVPK